MPETENQRYPPGTRRCGAVPPGLAGRTAPSIVCIWTGLPTRLMASVFCAPQRTNCATRPNTLWRSCSARQLLRLSHAESELMLRRNNYLHTATQPTERGTHSQTVRCAMILPAFPFTSAMRRKTPMATRWTAQQPELRQPRHVCGWGDALLKGHLYGLDQAHFAQPEKGVSRRSERVGLIPCD